MIRGNIIKMLLARGGALPSNQHAFYSLGLIDYLKDDLVVRLLDCIYDRLKEGGLVLLGNFRPNHSNADFFQHALDWQLKLRNEDQLLALVSRSKFRSGSIGSEAEGIQLFAQCEK
jgi:hypothetical protein